MQGGFNANAEEICRNKIRAGEAEGAAKVKALHRRASPTDKPDDASSSRGKSPVPAEVKMTKKTIWINVYRKPFVDSNGNAYPTKELAERWAGPGREALISKEYEPGEGLPNEDNQGSAA